MLTNFTKGNNSIAQAVIASQFSFGVIALTYFLLTEQFDMIGYAVVFHYFMFMFCHNVSLHRYFAHRSFETSKFWHIIMCVVSPIACGGSPYSYAVAHRTHHAYSDTKNDPHSPANSSLLDVAFFNWNLKAMSFKFAKHLNDKWIVFSHNYYLLIILVFALLIMTIDVELLFVYNLAVLFNFFGFLCVNVLSHKQTVTSYKNANISKDQSTNDLVTGFLFGEWHSNHHNNPCGLSQKSKWWEFDPASIIISLISKR